YTISTEKKGPWSRFCERHEIRSVDDLKKHGLIPGFIDIDTLKRAVDKVMSPASRGSGAGRQPKHERIASSAIADRQISGVFNPGRISQVDNDHDVAGVVEELGHQIALPVRKSIAIKAVQLARVGSYAINAFHVDDDMEVRAPLIFDTSISLCEVQNLRVRSGASIESQAPYFILRARSFSGTWRSRGAPGRKADNGPDGSAGGPGTPGRNAVCRDMLHSDLVPTNGGAGGNAGPGGDGADGGNGSDGGSYEAHLQVLSPGIVVDTSGG